MTTELDRAMSARRIELGMRWRDVADAAGISYETLRAVRRGANEPSPLTKRGIERALQWAAGAFDAATAGQEPQAVTQSADPPYANLADPHERAVWESPAEPQMKRQIIDLIRKGKRTTGPSEQAV